MSHDGKFLIGELEKLVGEERRVLAKFLKVLSEIEKTKAHVEAGYSTLFSFLVKRYGFSEDCAQRRVLASRACTKFPLALEMVQSGRIHLSGLCLLASSLTEENANELLSKAAGKSKREIEEMIFFSKPAAKVRDQMKVIGVAPIALASTREPVAMTSMFKEEVTQAEEIFEEKIVVFKFSASEKLQKKFERAKEVLWHKCPSGKFEEIFDAALDALLAAKDPDEKIKRQKPRKKVKASTQEKPTRYIKSSIKKEVWKRDNGQCTYISPEGYRCSSKTALEFNHKTPWAKGGESTVENLELYCRQHNVFHAEQHFHPHRCG